MNSSANTSQTPSEPPTAGSAEPHKPRFAIFLATACGLGYIPVAPGTFGSLAGLLLALAPYPLILLLVFHTNLHLGRIFASIFPGFDPILSFEVFVTFAVAIIGVWAASRAATFWGQKDPQRVVIDEVSGQHLALLLGCGIPVWWQMVPPTRGGYPFGLITSHTELGWKYILLGFILFRVFDIWKPFPVRRAESLRGGWGIMADDWVAGIYAGLCLWAARAFLHL